MKQGRTLQQLLEEIVRQQETKRDFIADTRNLEFDELRLNMADKSFPVNEIAHEQIAGHVKIPRPYYDRMRQEEPELFATNVNTWFRKYPAVRMIRTLDDGARSFLSNSYRSLDNSDLLEAALPPLLDRGVEVMSCDVTDRKLYLKVVDQRIKRDLPVGWSMNNRGHQHFDTVCPALVLSNSEVGCGALSVQTSVWTGGCTNLMVIQERSHRKAHLGSKLDLGDDVYKMLSDTTKKLTDAALWAQIKDVVGLAFDRAQFDVTCDKLEAAGKDLIEGDPVKTVEVAQRHFGFNDTERGSILRHLISGGDLSRYGLLNAVTRTAEDLDNYDRASEFEALGGKVLELPRADWRRMAEAA